MEGNIPLILALLCLVAMSAFFSATETAYTSLNRVRLKSRADNGDKRAAKTLALAEDYDKLLSTILIGNNIVNNVATTIGAVLFIVAILFVDSDALFRSHKKKEAEQAEVREAAEELASAEGEKDGDKQ